MLSLYNKKVLQNWLKTIMIMVSVELRDKKYKNRGENENQHR
jgi:hypothetical protein